MQKTQSDSGTLLTTTTQLVLEAMVLIEAPYESPLMAITKALDDKEKAIVVLDNSAAVVEKQGSGKERGSIAACQKHKKIPEHFRPPLLSWC